MRHMLTHLFAGRTDVDKAYEKNLDTKVERLVLDDKISLATKLKELLKSLQAKGPGHGYGYDYDSMEEWEDED